MASRPPTYYNENDPFAAQWLRNLIKAGHLPHGSVDERSIVDVRAGDLVGYRQCHFFAGIGGWVYALRLAGWPDDREVWTGSCPCQPLSSAGQRRGHADERHLWPAFHALIAERRPATVFGEQVAGRDGREWLAGVRADLERAGYACGAADLCAAGVGAPHIRQRLFWVAQSSRAGAGRNTRGLSAAEPAPRWGYGPVSTRGATGGLADAGPGTTTDLHAGTGTGAERQPCRAGWLGDAASQQMRRAGQSWQDGVWLPCLDGKARRTQPGIFPLAHRATARVGRLRAYGNAIVPQVAAEFIKAHLECT